MKAYLIYALVAVAHDPFRSDGLVWEPSRSPLGFRLHVLMHRSEQAGPEEERRPDATRLAYAKGRICNIMAQATTSTAPYGFTRLIRVKL
jgi:hypothetical protein